MSISPWGSEDYGEVGTHLIRCPERSGARHEIRFGFAVVIWWRCWQVGRAVVQVAMHPVLPMTKGSMVNVERGIRRKCEEAAGIRRLWLEAFR